jgi:membrane protease YdiL (CAAX protease family)
MTRVSEGPGAPANRLTFDNPWIAAVDQAPRRASAWLVLAGGAAAGAAAALLGRAAGGAAMALGERIGGSSATIVGAAAFYLLVFAPLWAAALLGGAAEGRRVWPVERAPLPAALAGAAVGFGGFAAAVAIAAAAGGVVRGGAPATPALLGALVGALAFAWQVGGEEILFRGWMQPVMSARLGPAVGLVVVALLFAGLHLVAGVRSPLAVVNLILAGLMFGLLAMRTAGLWAPFCAHALWNWTEACALGLDPNPGVGPMGALLDLDLGGPALWSGGADGMNGSLATTLVLTAVVGGLLALRPRGG